MCHNISITPIHQIFIMGHSRFVNERLKVMRTNFNSNSLDWTFSAEPITALHPLDTIPTVKHDGGSVVPREGASQEEEAGD